MKLTFNVSSFASGLILIAIAGAGVTQRAAADTTFSGLASLNTYGINADFETPALAHVDTAEATSTANIGPGWTVNIIDGTSSNFGVADPNQTFYPFQSPGGPIVAPFEGRQYGFVNLDAGATGDTVSKTLGTIKSGQSYSLTVTYGVRGGSTYGLVYDIGLQTLSGADVGTFATSGILTTAGAIGELTYNLSSAAATPFVGQEAAIVIRGHNVQQAGAFSQANFDNVRLTGTFGDATLPTVTIDRSNGNVTLTKTGPDVTGFVGYELNSPAGSFNRAGWLSIADNYDDSGNDSVDADDDWTKLTAATDSTNLSESQMTGTPNNGGTLIGSVNLGSAWIKTPFQDVTGRLLFADGTIRTTTVNYAGTAVASGDLNGDGAINVADWTVFKAGQGTSFTTLTGVQGYLKGDMDGDKDHDLTDFIRFRTAYDAVNGAGSFAANIGNVPEPSAAMLCVLAAACGAVFRRRPAARFIGWRAASALALAFSIVVAIAGTASAAVKVDRLYSFGDDPLEGNPTIGSTIGNASTLSSRIGWTLDTVGPDAPDGVNFQDLQQFGGPTYAAAAGRPGAAAGSKAASFDGVDDVLKSQTGAGFNFPSMSPSSSNTPDTPKGAIDYSSIVNRGFQVWVRPDGTAMGTLQHVVHDMDQHGFRISAGGNWEMRYNATTFTSSTPVTFNQWHHVMVAIPFGVGGVSIRDNTDGEVMYVDGVAVAAIGGSYNLTQNTELIVGASNAATTANFYKGQLDDLEIFAWGKSGLGVNHGQFNLGQDNAFVKSQLTAVAGDINRDNSLNQADVDALVGGWHQEKVINNVRVGDLTTFAKGDLNFDGSTDLLDARLMINFLPGAGSGSGVDTSALFALASVPEPSALVLAATCVAAILGMARRGRRAEVR